MQTLLYCENAQVSTIRRYSPSQLCLFIISISIYALISFGRSNWSLEITDLPEDPPGYEMSSAFRIKLL